MIRVHDSYGRELFITKQQWRDTVLLGHLQKVWNNPDELAAVIIQSLRDGFAADMLKPAVHLVEIDRQPERASAILAIIYLELKRPDDVEKVLRRFIEQHGLEQMLAVRCAGLPGVPARFLSGERDMLDGNLQLCLNQPDNVVTRVVLNQTLARMRKVKPQAVDEFRDRMLMLQKEKPLPEPAHSVLQRILNEVLASLPAPHPQISNSKSEIPSPRLPTSLLDELNEVLAA